MSLNCFFGVELKPDGVPVTPLLPPRSSLVITQCSVTSVVPDAAATADADDADHHHHHKKSKMEAAAAAYAPVVLYVQGHEVPSKFAVATLAPQEGVTYSALQLVFSRSVTFTLQPRRGAGEAADGTAHYPSVHLTGYYECEEDDSDEETDGDDEEDSDDSEAEAPPRAPAASSRTSKRDHKAKADGGAHKKKKK
ncbi:hypothetical protein STCU_03306 [Strigomonas culicis]|uniref:Nucleoplasmin-like domain-containing protein n=1 Tax=Strigomonas culicis TaxID=28005 RepID=S9USF4_9TRYP|nr:hypothetical protein STCU_03306 [Strigomonas culicis]|eukprot:EPY31719.1 hypothetical protein STCU_03306 [Strigomonas culicis]